MMVLPILLLQPREAVDEDPTPPPNHFPLFANLGALLLGIGWLGWGLSQPFHLSGVILDWHRTAVNVLLGMAGAVVTAQLYAWLATGEPGALLAAQGLSAGWGAVLASAPFLPTWAALMIGLLAGLAFPLVHYAIHTLLRIRDAAAVVALALTSGPLGLLGVALLADGRWGQGWNVFGTVEDALATPGVAGVFVTGNAGQLSAQLVGLISVALWAILWGGGLGVLASPRLLSGLRFRRRALRTDEVEPSNASSEDTSGDDGTTEVPDVDEPVDDPDLEVDLLETAVGEASVSGSDGDGNVAPDDGEAVEIATADVEKSDVETSV
jgi:ammonia channel protein AmtB